MRVALYARVSTVDQHCEMQLRELREYAARQNWAIIAEYVDNGVSGRKSSRPKLDEMIADARRHCFDIVLVWKIDRIMRSLRAFSNLLGELDAWNVALVSATQPIDTRDKITGRLMVNILAAIAEFEADMISERVRAGIANARAKGKHLGRPFRYNLDELLPKVQALADQGLSCRQIAVEVGANRETIRRLRRNHVR